MVRGGESLVGAYFRGFLALKSLVVGVAILVLWGRSYFVGDHVRRGSETQWIELGSASGSTIVTFGHDGKATKLTGASWQYLASRDPRKMLRDVGVTQDTVVHRLGFGFQREMYNQPVRGLIYHIVIPHWLVFLLAVPSALKWVWRRSRPPGAKRDPVAAAAERYKGMWECPTCGQTYAKPPTYCAICRTQLGVEEFV
jgi:hypothetical protein